MNEVKFKIQDLYNFIERKQDVGGIETVYPMNAFPLDEQPLVRLEILTWWKIERLVEDGHCKIDKIKAIKYFENRIRTTKNLLFKYRYSYFAFLLSHNNQFAKYAIDAMIGCIESLLPNKDDYPHNAEDAIRILLLLSRRIKYRINDVSNLMWGILYSEYGYMTKIVCIKKIQESCFFQVSNAEKMAELCKSLFYKAKDRWKESCCEAGLFYAAKLQRNGNKYKRFFYESMGDIEMAQLKNPNDNPENIAIPHINGSHLEKAIAYYQEARVNDKIREAEKVYRENKKNLTYFGFKVQKKTNEDIVKYYSSLKNELLNDEFCKLMSNLAQPTRFCFPSYKKIQEWSSGREFAAEHFWENKIKDINGNTRKASENFELMRKYKIWLMNLMRNYVLDIILTAVQTKFITFAKLKSWFLKRTCFGKLHEYRRINVIITTTWFSQIEYAIDTLVKQYKRFMQGKQSDWRIPIDTLSLRFEGIIRDMIVEYGGNITKVDRNGNTSQALLDDLLREPCMELIFTEEDTDFFEYVFTPKGLNIRNNVAHAFYLPQDYGIIQATLVFLCILRLTSFQ